MNCAPMDRLIWIAPFLLAFAAGCGGADETTPPSGDGNTGAAPPQAAGDFIAWTLGGDPKIMVEYFAAEGYSKFSARESVDRALAADPEVILADEPTSFQDLEGVHRMAAVFKDWRNKGCTVIISGHDPRLSDLPGLIDRRYRLENGRLEVEG